MDCSVDELEHWDDTTKDIPEAVENINSCLDELDNLDDTTKNIPVEEENVASPTKSEDLKTLFPHLKNTNTESLVLWDFLWALLKDENYKKTVTWVSFPHLKFSIVNPSSLATLFGQVKQNPTMDWSKIKKILDLYLRKNRIISIPTEEHEFTYRIVPKSENAALVSKNATPRDNPVAAKSIASCLDELDTSDDTTKDIRVAAKSIEIYLDKLDAKHDFTKNIPVTPVSYLDELDTQNHTTKDLLETVESMGNNLGKTITVNPEISKRMDCCLDELEPLDDTTKDIPEAVENINSCFDELDNLDDTTKDIPVEEENVASPTKSEDLKTLFPYLKNTNTESLVLWDFLWALLRDQNYKKTVTWVSFPHLKFSIVNPST